MAKHSRIWPNDSISSEVAHAAYAGATRHPQPSLAALADPTPSPNPILPDFDSDNFSQGERIDNPYFPNLRGTVYTYDTVNSEDGEVEHEDVYTTFESKTVLGVKTTPARDTVYVDGRLVEDTIDYYAQDRDGNVWYFGELSYSFEYDDDGNYIGTSTEGSWLADGVNAFPGYIMPSRATLESLGTDYRQEYAPGIAEDQARLMTFDAKVHTDLGNFRGVLQTLDSTQLEPDVREHKKYEPSIGLIQSQDLTADGEVISTTELTGVRLLRNGAIGHELFRDTGDLDLKDIIQRPDDLGDHEQPELREFTHAGSAVHVTYLGGEVDPDDALGFYTFDSKTGAFDEVGILFADAGDVEIGEDFVIELDKGQGYGLFLVPDGADIGLDLSDFEDGGLKMRNFVTGEPATIYDRLAPQIVDEDGTPLPIPALHALDVNTHDDWNLLNPAGGIQAAELEPDALEHSAWDDKADVIGFEDTFASDLSFDGDFDDVVVAVSQSALPAKLVADISEELNLAGAGL